MSWRGRGGTSNSEMELWMGVESMVRGRGWWVRQVTYWFHAKDSLKEDNGCVAYSMVHADICPAWTTDTVHCQVCLHKPQIQSVGSTLRMW